MRHFRNIILFLLLTFSDEVDMALKRTYAQLFKLGLFDPIEDQYVLEPLSSSFFLPFLFPSPVLSFPSFILISLSFDRLLRFFDLHHACAYVC